jgi:asparagine synthase (glutamine-hydrolysing)
MCGITGIVDWGEDLTLAGPTLERMITTLSHRGPDAAGSWLSPRAALGHTRLIVIDPEGGTQPMVYEHGDRTYALTYNGELYNFRELRAELQSRGHHFRTYSDTEVLLHAYVEWEEGCVDRFNGIFAFGLWDEQKQQLLLARDHLGVKPLFYATRGSGLLFGSELKSLLAHPAIKAEIDATGLAEVFGFRRAPGSGVFRGVAEVRAGHLLTAAKGRVRVKPYWQLHSAAHSDDLPNTIEHVRFLLEDTVKRQLVADQPVVTMLSGGLDSSGLTALAAKELEHQGKSLHTYAIDFVEDGPSFHAISGRSQDLFWAQRVAHHVGSQHHVITVGTEELVDALVVPMRAHDLPTTMGNLETSLYLVFKAMKEDAVVTLSGESSDEVFGGYPWFHNEPLLQAPTFPWPWAGLLGHSSSGAPSFLSNELIRQVKPAEHIARCYHEALSEVPVLSGEDPQEARRRVMHYLNLAYFLPQMLDRKDRMSMAVGFEARVPYCDHRLVEYVWNIPWAMKDVGRVEKGILRRALSGVLADDVRARRKEGGFPPVESRGYFQAIRARMLQILANPNSTIQPYVNVAALRRLATGSYDLIPAGPAPQLFALAVYERVIQTNAWFEEYHVSVCSS